MSAVIKTVTPFVLEDVLVEALSDIGAEPNKVVETLPNSFRQYKVKIGDILTNRQDYNGRQLFRFEDDRWVMVHDSDEYHGRITSSRAAGNQYKPVAQFLTELDSAYRQTHQRHIEKLEEQERIRVEQERIERVETTRQKTIEKARAQGYSVKEGCNSKGQIQLVLTRLA